MLQRRKLRLARVASNSQDGIQIQYPCSPSLSLRRKGLKGLRGRREMAPPTAPPTRGSAPRHDRKCAGPPRWRPKPGSERCRGEARRNGGAAGSAPGRTRVRGEARPAPPPGPSPPSPPG